MKSEHGIDITELEAEEALSVVGTGDWLVALIDGVPDIIIPARWRMSLHEYAAKQFVRWVIAGVDRSISHDSDPSCDSSGSIRRTQTDSLMLLIRHESLQDWATAEYNGRSNATFISGMGLAWETYADMIGSHVEDEAYKLLRIHCLQHLGGDEDALDSDPQWDETLFILGFLGAVLQCEALLTTTAAAWQQYEMIVRAEIAAEKEKSAAFNRDKEHVHDFWLAHFPDLTDMRIEVPHYRALNLERRISECLADTDPAIVRLIAHPDMHLPGNYSNSVRMLIRAIAQRSLINS